MKRLFLSALLLAPLVSYCSAANLAYSTYLRYGFTPKAMTSDAQGNLYLAGSGVIDPLGGIEVQAGDCPANVENVARSGIVYKVDVRLPATLLPCATFTSNAINPLFLTITYNDAPVGPLMINSSPAPATLVKSQLIRVWATQ